MACRGYWGAEFDCLTGAGDLMSELDGELISPAGSVLCTAGSERSGKLGYRATMGSGGYAANVRFGGQAVLPGQVISWRFYMRLEGYPAEDTIFAQFGGGFLHADLYMRPDGRIHFGGSPQVVPGVDTPLPVGSWVRIEAALAYSDPAVSTPQGSIFQVRVNGESVYRRCGRRPAPIGSSPGDANDACVIGWGDSSSPGLVMHFDDVGIYEGVWGGEGKVERLQVTSMELEERWVPGAWRNVYKRTGDDDHPRPACYCGDSIFVTFYPPASFSGMASGFNATPPTGFAAVHALEPPIALAYGRDYGEDYMVSSPGREEYLRYESTVISGCLICGVNGLAGLGYSDQLVWTFDTRYPPEADPANSLVCHLAGASGNVRNARWAILAARGDPYPGGVSGVGTGYTASVFMQGVEANTRNLDFRDGLGFGEGGDFPNGWTGKVGPIRTSPGGISAVEMERDPGSTLMQVCMLTAIVEVGGPEETIPICKRSPMSWM